MPCRCVLEPSSSRTSRLGRVGFTSVSAVVHRPIDWPQTRSRWLRRSTHTKIASCRRKSSRLVGTLLDIQPCAGLKSHMDLIRYCAMDCPVCEEQLRVTVYREDDEFKSCPRCSARDGRHVFYALDDFGDRRPHGGDAIIQSWCRPCRGDRAPGLPAGYCVQPTRMPAPRLPETDSSSRAG